MPTNPSLFKGGAERSEAEGLAISAFRCLYAAHCLSVANPYPACGEEPP